MNYCFHPEAEAEHLETVAYYESKRPGLGVSYLTEFEGLMTSISEAPYRFPIELEPDIRRKRMNKFPFTILYRATPDSIQVLALAQHRRRPRYWQKRR